MTFPIFKQVCKTEISESHIVFIILFCSHYKFILNYIDLYDYKCLGSTIPSKTFYLLRNQKIRYIPDFLT